MKTLIMLVVLAVSATAQTVSLADLYREKRKLETDRAEMLVRYAPDNSAVKDKEVAIAVVDKMIAETESKFRSNYDKFDDMTWVYSPVMNLGNMRLEIVWAYGSKVAPVFVIPSFAFRNTTGEPMWKGRRDAILLIDGERFQLPAGRHRTADQNSITGNETLSFSVETRIVKRLGEAKSVELRVGFTEAKLSVEHLAVIKEVYSRLSGR